VNISIPDGRGIFLRTLRAIAPEIAARHLSFIAVPVLVRGVPRNRSREWFDRFQGEVIAWSWFDAGPEKLPEAFRFAASIGASTFVLNAEKGWRGRSAVKYAERARVLANERGMALGLVSYARPGVVRDFPWADFAARVDFGMPEIYDRRGVYDPKYPGTAIAEYLAAGFREVLPACGIYVRREGGGWRYRTGGEMSRHLAYFPPGPVCAWTLGGRIPERTLAEYADA